MIAPDYDPLQPRLLTLERRIEDVSLPLVTAGSMPDYPFRLQDEIFLFTKEVETNLTDPYGEKYGTIALKRQLVDVRYGLGNLFLSSFLLTLPNLLGLPFMHIRYTLFVDIRIMDRNNRLMGSYTATGSSSVKVAYYYGYSLRNAHADRKAYTDALKDALNKIRPQLKADTPALNEKLTAAGKL